MLKEIIYLIIVSMLKRICDNGSFNIGFVKSLTLSISRGSEAFAMFVFCMT